MPGEQIFSGVAQGISGLISGVTGALQRHKGNKLLKGLTYPTETLPAEFEQNQNLAQTMAANGMPSEQYNLAMKNIQRQQLMALRSANDRRGGLNVLPALLQGGNDATLKLDAENATQRTANQRNLINVNSQVGNEKRDIFDKNVRQKYMNDYQYAMSLLGAGNQNLTGGIDKFAAAAGASLYGATNKRNNYAGTDGTGGY